jgi:hypothetical protein
MSWTSLIFDVQSFQIHRLVSLPEASDVYRRSYVDWGFRCRLRPSRLDIGKTEARHEKSSWRLSISCRHDARERRASVQPSPLRQIGNDRHRLNIAAAKLFRT